jgi:hypothetical protein
MTSGIEPATFRLVYCLNQLRYISSKFVCSHMTPDFGINPGCGHVWRCLVHIPPSGTGYPGLRFFYLKKERLIGSPSSLCPPSPFFFFRFICYPCRIKEAYEITLLYVCLYTPTLIFSFSVRCASCQESWRLVRPRASCCYGVSSPLEAQGIDNTGLWSRRFEHVAQPCGSTVPPGPPNDQREALRRSHCALK